jgi:hypothetical protein
VSDQRPVGPHIDQNARDVLDDLGLLATHGIAVGTVTNGMEVMG